MSQLQDLLLATTAALAHHDDDDGFYSSTRVGIRNWDYEAGKPLSFRKGDEASDAKAQDNSGKRSELSSWSDRGKQRR